MEPQARPTLTGNAQIQPLPVPLDNTNLAQNTSIKNAWATVVAQEAPFPVKVEVTTKPKENGQFEVTKVTLMSNGAKNVVVSSYSDEVSATMAAEALSSPVALQAPQYTQTTTSVAPVVTSPTVQTINRGPFTAVTTIASPVAAPDSAHLQSLYLDYMKADSIISSAMTASPNEGPSESELLEAMSTFARIAADETHPYRVPAQQNLDMIFNLMSKSDNEKKDDDWTCADCALLVVCLPVVIILLPGYCLMAMADA